MTNKTKTDCISTALMAEKLGISPDTLHRRRESGEFKFKTHWTVKNPHAARKTYVWHEKRVLKAAGVGV